MRQSANCSAGTMAGHSARRKPAAQGQQVLLGASGQTRTGGVYTQAQPVYTFNTTARNRGPFDSQSGNGYNLAITLRYLF